ncbi:MAG TPA: hypothetical protein EYG35_00650 [Gammaproteobacteria bacterium]|nr:hypothetical protein [Gammaproteobacteria bacterium]
MHKSILKILLRPDILLMSVFCYVLILHTEHEDLDLFKYLVPENIYLFNLTIFFEADNEIEISTFLPLRNDRQEILDETIIANDLQMEDNSGIDGRKVSWFGNQKANQISYSGMLSMQSVNYAISQKLIIPNKYPGKLNIYLESTDYIPVHHKEIIKLWDDIKPTNQRSTYQTLNSIYSYTNNHIKSIPFKGLTDSLTALRLGVASCNGKSRLFISLARLSGLPARLVGGVILDNNKKKTSHQWVEVYIEDYWVPFDVTNGHFASLPKNYLELYKGDHNLFRHSANINFNYYFISSKYHIAQVLYRDIESNNHFIPNAAKSLRDLGLPLKVIYIFLLFPFCTLIITFQRNIIGIKTFGTFMPMLIAAVCVYTGFSQGLTGFSMVLLIAYLGHTVLGKLHILKIPRLAAIITLISIASLTWVSLIDQPIGVEFSTLLLFPAVIISFTADRIHQLSDESNWIELIESGAGTLLTIFLCYQAFNSILLQGLFALYSELLLCVLALLLHIGNWSGMRVLEVIRFRNLFNIPKRNILSINDRNKNFIYKHNDKKLLHLASDKLLTKKSLEQEGIPCPETWAICRSQQEIYKFMATIENKTNFVIKPNNGSCGNGILILCEHVKNGFRTSSGKLFTTQNIKNHIGEILSGSFSQKSEEDQVYIEPIIRQHDILRMISPRGLCDIRLIISNGKLINAMLRVPTLKSNDKANIHQGAIGAAINLKTGNIERALLKGREITHHPDTKLCLQQTKIPFWNHITTIALQCYKAIPLGYMGVDICIDQNTGPLVLEVNGRPGLEIQNIHKEGMSDQIREAFSVV